MKIRLLILLVFSVTLLSLGTIFAVPDAFGLCVPSTDWPDEPCYGCFGCYPGIEQEKIDWAPYYDFKGSEWMESKKQEMIQAIQNDTLFDWIESTPKTQAHHNVHEYYFLLGEVPNLDGKFVDESFVESISQDKTIGEPKPEHNIVNEMNLEKAMQNLRKSFHENVSFGPFNMKDVIVGYGTESGSITVDVKTEYYESEYLEIVKENIQEIAGDVHVKYISADEITDEQICGAGNVLVDGVCVNPNKENFDAGLNQIILFISIVVIGVVIFVIIWRKRK